MMTKNKRCSEERKKVSTMLRQANKRTKKIHIESVNCERKWTGAHALANHDIVDCRIHVCAVDLRIYLIFTCFKNAFTDRCIFFSLMSSRLSAQCTAGEYGNIRRLTTYEPGLCGTYSIKIRWCLFIKVHRRMFGQQHTDKQFFQFLNDQNAGKTNISVHCILVEQAMSIIEQ